LAPSTDEAMSSRSGLPVGEVWVTVGSSAGIAGQLGGFVVPTSGSEITVALAGEV
jgi:hypothetical protein